MYLIDYDFYGNNSLELIYRNGQSVNVQLDSNSGKIITRIKRQTFHNVQHTGIYLGIHAGTGEVLIVHNHVDIGYPAITTLKTYEAGKVSTFQNKRVRNDHLTTLERGLNLVIKRRAYHLANYNCQTFTNIAANNVAKSEDYTRVARKVLSVASVFTVIGLLGTIFD